MAPGEGSPANSPHGEEGSPGWQLARGLDRGEAVQRRKPQSQPSRPVQRERARRTVPGVAPHSAAAPLQPGTGKAATYRLWRERPRAGPEHTAIGASRRGGAPSQLAAPASRRPAAPAARWHPSTCRRRNGHTRFPTGGECKRLAACPRGQLGQEARRQARRRSESHGLGPRRRTGCPYPNGRACSAAPGALPARRGVR